jgi:hypothetical protein
VYVYPFPRISYTTKHHVKRTEYRERNGFEKVPQLISHLKDNNNNNNNNKDHLEDPSVDGRIILKWIFRNWDGLDRAGSG